MKTKKGTLTLILILIAISLALCSCKTTHKTPEQYDVDYSLNTLLIMVEDKSDTDAINAMFDKYDVTIIYDYENFMMYAVSLSHQYSPAELDDLIEELEKEELVVAVNKDYIYSIDPITF